MAKINKRLKKLVTQMVRSSINSDGGLNTSKVESFSKDLKKMSITNSAISLKEFVKAIKRQVDKTTLIIKAPIDLSVAIQKQIANSLEDEFMITDIKFVKDPSLLGGLQIKIGDILIDDSVRDRVNQLKERIIHV